MSFRRFMGFASLILKKHGPTIATGAGVVGMVVSTVWSCKQTLKIEAINVEFDEKEKELDEKIEKVKELQEEGKISAEKYSEADIATDRKIVKGRRYWEYVKLYIAPGLLGAVSLGLICWGHSSLLKDNAALAGAFTGLTEAFNEYRKRVREDIGEEKDREYFTGMKTEERVLTNPDTGETFVEKVQVPTAESVSIYAKDFNETNPNFNPKSHMQNLFFLTRAEKIFTDRLRARGYVFLNEVYEYLRIPQTYEGQHVGWVVGEKGDNFVDFGIKSYLNEMKAEDAWYRNDIPQTIRLDFNVDGSIMYIFDKTFGKEYAEKLVHS